MFAFPFAFAFALTFALALSVRAVASKVSRQVTLVTQPIIYIGFYVTAVAATFGIG